MTAPESKRAGILRDPWRALTSKQSPSDSTEPPAPTLSEKAAVDAGDDINGDMEGKKTSTIELKNYGGITVQGAESPSHAAAQVLKFCVDNLKIVEETLISFGVLVTRLHPGKLTTPFYVQRADGWTLAIPMVKNRDEGCLQLIQALLALRTNPIASAKMRELKIQPYKV
jgi:hypothetical protein